MENEDYRMKWRVCDRITKKKERKKNTAQIARKMDTFCVSLPKSFACIRNKFSCSKLIHLAMVCRYVTESEFGERKTTRGDGLKENPH